MATEKFNDIFPFAQAMSIVRSKHMKAERTKYLETPFESIKKFLVKSQGLLVFLLAISTFN